MEKRSQNSLVTAQVRELLDNLFSDLRLHHPHLQKSLSLDLKTVHARLEEEGKGFVMHTLPKIGKAIYTALETGHFICPCGLVKQKGTALPRFFGGLLKCIANDDGSLKVGLDETVLVDLIQLCFFFYKLDVPCAPKRALKVIESFKEVEVQLSRLTLDESDELLDAAAVLAEKVLQGFNPGDITPRHGPGAVATGEKRADKWVFKRKYEALHRVYPYYEYFTPSRESLLRSITWYKSLEHHEAGTAKVVLVPKDARGPRLISMEPLEYQFIQQGLGRALVRHFEKKSPWTRRYVNFTDQCINRDLALHNSVTRRYATLDMKEASDRVSLELVRRIFARRPDVLRSLEASRTVRTELPDGEIIELKKFAPMGSALCFPVEAFVFWLLAKVIMKRERIVGRVYVYGDDIVVPCELVPRLFELFPKYGLMFNEDKCFTSGYFRESCGLDAYKGFICTPVRLRKLLPQSRKQPELIVSAVELANYLHKRGYWRTSRYVAGVVQQHWHVGILTAPSVNFGGLSLVSFTSKGVTSDGKVRIRWNLGLQKHECKVPQAYQPVKTDAPVPEGRLFMNLVNQTQLTHAVPHAAAIKMRWTHFY